MERTGLAYGLAAFLAWGIVPLYWKTVAHVPAVEILAHRIVWATVLALALMAAQRRLGDVLRCLADKRKLATLLLSAVLIGGNWGLYIWAVNSGHVLESSLGYFINPLLNVLLGRLVLKEALSRLQLAAIILAAVSVVSLAAGIGAFPWISIGLATSFALYGYIRKIAPVDALLGLTVESLLLAPVAAIYLGWLGAQGTGAFLSGSTKTDLLLVSAGVVTALPLLWFAHAARRLPLSTVGILQYLAPSCQFLLAVFVFMERFTTRHLVCFLGIWTACALYTGASFRLARGKPRA